MLPELEAVLAARGETVKRPAHNAKPIPSTDDANDNPKPRPKMKPKTNYPAPKLRSEPF